MTAARLLLLSGTDEARQPYGDALENLGFRVEWVDSPEALFASVGTTPPVAVIVDLDTLGAAPPLDAIRVAFPASELIALSSSDSAQVALHCIRNGFTEFLLKPASPEELAWSVRKAEQRGELFRRMDDRRAGMSRAILQLASCNNPAVVRLSAVEYVVSLFAAGGAAWINAGQVLASFPTQQHPEEVLWRFPEKFGARRKPVVLRGAFSERRKVILPCKDPAQGAVFLWDIDDKVPARRIADGLLLVHHAELSLMNLGKLEEIKKLTFLDDLTGLFNSRYLRFALTNAMLRCKEPGRSFSVLFIDVDHFKSVNDRHGHLVGSSFLIAIGRTIKNAVRHVDSVFRYGGDEFVVILQDTPLKEASDVAERIRKNVERRVFALGTERVQTTVSIGLAGYPDTAQDIETLLQLADEALYAVKKDNRNAVQLAVVTPKPPANS